MKLIINQDLLIPETEIIINCSHMDFRLQQLIDLIRQYSFSLTGYQGEQEFQLPLEQIHFIDSADGKTFLYLEKEVYSCRETLAALEDKLSRTSFTRIPSVCICFTLITLADNIYECLRQNRFSPYLIIFFWLILCQVIDVLISRLPFQKYTHYCLAESAVLYVLTLLIFRLFIWERFSIRPMIIFTVIFLVTDIFIFWYFRKRQQLIANEINEML